MDEKKYQWLCALNKGDFQREWRLLTHAEKTHYRKIASENKLLDESCSVLQWDETVSIENIRKEAKFFLDSEYNADFHIWVQSDGWFELRHDDVVWGISNNIFLEEEALSEDSKFFQKILPEADVRQLFLDYRLRGISVALVREDSEDFPSSKTLSLDRDVYLAYE